MKKKAIILDRDGVINKRASEHDYIKSVKEVNILPDVPEAVRLINTKGFLVIIVTNQAGVARQIMTENSVHEIHFFIKTKLQELGARIDDILSCFHHYNDESCDCRKPKPGLIKQAVEKWQIDLGQSWLIGDSKFDLQAGLNAGIDKKRLILIESDSSLLQHVKRIINGK